MARKGMADYAITLKANEEQSLNVEGDFFHVIKATSEIGLRFDEGRAITRSEGMGGRVYYDRVAIKSPIAQTVVVSLGFGYATDARASANVQVSTTIENANVNESHPTIAIAPGQTRLLAPADPARKVLRVALPSESANAIFIGDSTTTVLNEGGLLEPGQIDYLPTEGAVYAYNAGASANVFVSVLSFRRV